MEKIYNKLVRDNIPEIIKNNGEEPIISILDDNEYKKELKKENTYLVSSLFHLKLTTSGISTPFSLIYSL